MAAAREPARVRRQTGTDPVKRRPREYEWRWRDPYAIQLSWWESLTAGVVVGSFTFFRSYRRLFVYGSEPTAEASSGEVLMWSAVVGTGIALAVGIDYRLPHRLRLSATVAGLVLFVVGTVGLFE